MIIDTKADNYLNHRTVIVSPNEYEKYNVFVYNMNGKRALKRVDHSNSISRGVGSLAYQFYINQGITRFYFSTIVDFGEDLKRLNNSEILKLKLQCTEHSYLGTIQKMIIEFDSLALKGDVS